MVDPSSTPSRRSVVRGAAWSAPVIVLATAAPAVAASGPASVVTTVPPTSDNSATTLPVTINFTNSNTGSTGLTTVTVRFQVAGFLTIPEGSVTDAAPTGVTPGWVPGVPTGTGTNRVFTFTKAAPGIAGTATGTATPVTTTLSFTVGITRQAVTGLSAGSISVTTTAASGTVANGNGAWT